MSRTARLWIVSAIVLSLAAVLFAIGLTRWLPSFDLFGSLSGSEPKAPLTPRLDRTGPYLILATEQAAQSYPQAMEIARQLHPDAVIHVFSVSDTDSVGQLFSELQPYYAMVFIMPEELDVNLAWRWLELTTAVDDDPFVDVRCGFITGKTPSAATAFMGRIRDAVNGQLVLPGALVDNLGPNTSASKTMFQKNTGSFFLPSYEVRTGVTTVSHGTTGFTREHLSALNNAGILHFGGHGYPDRIVDGLPGTWTVDLKLSPNVTFNGACYTGVTGRWYDINGPRITAQEVAPDESFCLGMLSNATVGYLAALHPDHGIPVYQEIEYMAYTGETLGNVIKHTHDGVILANGSRLPSLPTLQDGMQRPTWTPSDFMLIGTASRVLFGDPALTVNGWFTRLPFSAQASVAEDGSLFVDAVVDNPELKSTFTDTYHADMAENKRLFNDCARIALILPQGMTGVSAIESVRVTADGTDIPARVKGFAVEHDVTGNILHVQVDVPTRGYMQSRLRQMGARVTFVARP